MTKIVVIGAGGHARVVMDALLKLGGYEIVGLTDPRADLHGKQVDGVTVLGDDAVLPSLLQQGIRAACMGIGGIGDNRPRANAFDHVRSLGFSFVNVVHPSAVVASTVRMGTGNTLAANSVLNAGAVVGADVIVNTGATVDHECVIGDHVHISPGATLSGGVTVGAMTHIGSGAVVMQGIRIGECALVAAGAVVVRNVAPGAKVAGVPARAMPPMR